jgi:hypothetical protein
METLLPTRKCKYLAFLDKFLILNCFVEVNNSFVPLNHVIIRLRYSGYSENTINIASCGLQEGSFGLVVGSNSASNDRIDFAGIGEDVISFKPNEDNKTTAEEARIKGSGTSFAASHVTGFIAALLDKEQTQDKDYTRKEDLLTLLKDKFVIDMKLYGDGKDNATGEGFLTYLDETEFMTQQLSENFRQQTDAIQTMTQIMTQTMLQRYSDNFRRQAEVLQKWLKWISLMASSTRLTTLDW